MGKSGAVQGPKVQAFERLWTTGYAASPSMKKIIDLIKNGFTEVLLFARLSMEAGVIAISVVMN